MLDLSVIQTALEQAVSQGVFPGAVLAIRHGGNPVVQICAGHLSTIPEGPPVQRATIYDLASLTKPLATVTSLALLIQQGRCQLHDRVTQHLPECVDSPIEGATLWHLLTHSSGLPGWRGFYERLSPNGTVPRSRGERERAKQSVLALIAAEAPVYERGTRSFYSDLGFMLLGMIVERCSGRSLGEFFCERIGGLLGDPRAEFVLAERVHEFVERGRETGGVAATEVDPWRGRMLCGEVHDQNAGALGGEAGHAGLFGTAEAVLAVMGEWIHSYHGRKTILDQAIVREFTRRQMDQATSSWALGWDTPSGRSSAGRYFPPESFGHLGYTGTSMWVDPVHELEVVLLSNRVHPTSKNEAIRDFRPLVHDLVYEAFVGSR